MDDTIVIRIRYRIFDATRKELQDLLHREAIIGMSFDTKSGDRFFRVRCNEEESILILLKFSGNAAIMSRDVQW